jgi:hypothetical protein
MGGTRDVVNNEIEQIPARDPHDREMALALLRSAFIPWLTTVNPDNDRPMRRVARESDLPDTGGLIEAFVAKRLLVRDERGGEVVVEVALESLLRQWDELAGWLRDERQNLKTADDIEHDANAWTARGRDPSWLLTGTRLVDAETLAETPGFRERLGGTGTISAPRARPKTNASNPRNTTAKPNCVMPRNANRRPRRIRVFCGQSCSAPPSSLSSPWSPLGWRSSRANNHSAGFGKRWLRAWRVTTRPSSPASAPEVTSRALRR